MYFNDLILYNKYYVLIINSSNIVFLKYIPLNKN